MTIADPDISIEEASRALRRDLGEDYEVSVGSGDAMKVSSSALAYANVHMRKEAGATVFSVHGGGIVIGRIINELTLARRVATALRSGLVVEAK
ncbi:MAG: hypothetical protein QM729_19790 [Solirubrobacterales bacterium]